MKRILLSRLLGASIICFAILFFNKLSVAQHLGFFFEKGQNKVTLPIEIHNNLIVVPVTINERNTLKFILDTGVRSTILIHKDFTDTIGIAYKRKIQLYGAGDSTALDGFVTEPISMSLPGVNSTGISAVVLEKDFLQLKHHLGIEVHGLLGYDIFSRFVVKIDYVHEKITLYNPQVYNPGKKYDVIDLEVQESKPVIRINLQFNKNENLDARLLIDTGASHALVLDTNSNGKISLPNKYIEASLGRALGGEIHGYLGRIDGFDFGDKRLNDVIVSYPKVTEKDEQVVYDRNGSIGGELLKKFTVIFDFFNSKMYVKPNRTYKYSFEYNMSGLEFVAEGEGLNLYIIHNVRKNTTAFDAGFEPGDVLLSLNDIPSRKLDLTKIYTLLNRKEGKKINLAVYRDGKYISNSFYLQREI